MHRWSAHGMVAMVFLHMCRVFLTGSYKKPREFNWVLSVLLLLVTLFMSFTGYLLPWDQLAFWAITVGTSIAAYAPVIGKDIQFLLLGDATVGQEALLRFYVLHVAGPTGGNEVARGDPLLADPEGRRAVAVAGRRNRRASISEMYAFDHMGFAYKVLGISLAVTGVISPIIAAAAMVLSGISVLGNSRRLQS